METEHASLCVYKFYTCRDVCIRWRYNTTSFKSAELLPQRLSIISEAVWEAQNVKCYLLSTPCRRPCAHEHMQTHRKQPVNMKGFFYSLKYPHICAVAFHDYNHYTVKVCYVFCLRTNTSFVVFNVLSNTLCRPRVNAVSVE